MRQRSRETRRLWDRWIQVFSGMIKLAVRALQKIKGLMSERTIITVASF